jgi:glucuronokinase
VIGGCDRQFGFKSDRSREVVERWRRGDPEVGRAMKALAALADAGRIALERGDRAGFCERVERNFALRASLFEIQPRDRRLVELGRAAGAAVKFCGSGGSVLAVPRAGGIEPLRRAYLEAGCEVLLPEPGPGAGQETGR